MLWLTFNYVIIDILALFTLGIGIPCTISTMSVKFNELTDFLFDCLNSIERVKLQNEFITNSK